MTQLPHGSESFRKLNPHLYGPMGGLASAESKPVAAKTLVGGKSKQQGGGEGVAVRVSLIRCGRKPLDGHDNLRTAMKPLVDEIAASLGLDDADPRVSWEYGQVVTKGKPGVVVKIEKGK